MLCPIQIYSISRFWMLSSKSSENERLIPNLNLAPEVQIGVSLAVAAIYTDIANNDVTKLKMKYRKVNKA